MKKILLLLLIIAPLFSYSYATNGCSATNAQRKEKKDSLSILTDKANKGDAIAQNELGIWYYTGKNVSKDYKQALEWWAKSAKQDNPDAIGNMAMCYQLGNGTKKDTVMAMQLYKVAIKKGNKSIIPQHETIVKNTRSLFSARLLMDCYKEGIGVKKDFKKAEDYQLILVESGDSNQQFLYALACLNSQRTSEAAKWFKEVAKTGRKEAVYYYGYLLFNGMGVKQNKSEGLKLMAKAASQNMPAAQYQVGKAYYEGNGLSKNLSKAKELLSKAVASKNRNAAWLLGMCYIESDTSDYYLSAQWLAESARSHEKELGEFLKDSKYKNFQDYLLGLKKYYIDNDYDGAITLFKAVAKNGNSEGLTMQAVCLTNAKYAKRNAKKALKLFTKAIEMGSHSAEYFASSMYDAGEGMKKPDKEKALALLTQSAHGGIAYAQCALGDKFFSGNGVNKDLTKAAKLYLMAEAQDYLTPASARNLIKCYERGLSILPDVDNASKRIEALKKIKVNNSLTDFLKAIEE